MLFFRKYLWFNMQKFLQKTNNQQKEKEMTAKELTYPLTYSPIRDPMAKAAAQVADPVSAKVAASLPQFRKEVVAYKDQVFLNHQTAHEYRLYQSANNAQIVTDGKTMTTRDEENYRMSKVVAEKIRERKNKLLEVKAEIGGVRQSIKEAEDQYAQMTEEVNKDFTEKKDKLLEELREIEALLAHYAEWQRMADSFKSHLSELKSTIHRNRVLCSEGIAETRQNAQAKIEKHRIRLAEAIRQARAESLRLRPGDISNLTTQFLTQSEAHLQSLNSQIGSSQHLSDVNHTIDEDNTSLLKEIDKLDRKNQQLKDQEEKQKAVLLKLKAIRQEFQERDLAEAHKKKEAAARERQEKKREEEVRARMAPKPKPEFHLNSEQEAFITFLNECSTSIRSVMVEVLGEGANATVPQPSDRFEAPKLSAMINEIRQMTEKLSAVKPTSPSESKPILTPAAAYFAFSAPFDDSDDFIASENWSFAKYESFKVPMTKQMRPRIVRVRTVQRNAL
jgi:peptidoglycan hydrolase CwlO-like protein